MSHSYVSRWYCLGAVALFSFSWQGFMYRSINTYLMYSIYIGTALAAITAAQYLFAGGLLVYSNPLWTNLETYWTCTFLAGVATVLLPIPFFLRMWERGCEESSDTLARGSQVQVVRHDTKAWHWGVWNQIHNVCLGKCEALFQSTW